MIHDEIDGLATREVLLFCERCKRDAPPDDTLCVYCGDPLKVQGYCPICERHVRQVVGDVCPKHDVELVDGPSVPDFDVSTARLVTVAVFNLGSDVNPARLRLEAEGIPTFVQDERIGTQTLLTVATGGVKLQVPEESAADARVLLSQTWSAPTEGDDLDDPWEGLAPDPAERRRSIMKGAIVLHLFGPIILALILGMIALLAGWLG